MTPVRLALARVTSRRSAPVRGRGPAVEQHITQHTNDKQEIEPALAAIGHLPKALGEPENLLADTGYFSEANVEKCTQANLVPFIPEKREKHNLPLTDRFREAPDPPRNATVVQAMRDRLQTREGTKSRRFRRSGLCHTQIHSGNCLWDH